MRLWLNRSSAPPSAFPRQILLGQSYFCGRKSAHLDSAGQITIAGALDYETTQSYALTVQISKDDVNVTAQITITVTEPLTIIDDYDFDTDTNNSIAQNFTALEIASR